MYLENSDRNMDKNVGFDNINNYKKNCEFEEINIYKRKLEKKLLNCWNKLFQFLTVQIDYLSIRF